MTLISRRDAGKLVGKLLVGSSAAVLVGCEALAGSERINSVIRGVQIGSQSYSFRDRPLAAAIEGFRTVGLGECELAQMHLEPPKVSREELRQWRLQVPLSRFHQVRKQFEDAGILLRSNVDRLVNLAYLLSASDVQFHSAREAYASRL